VGDHLGVKYVGKHPERGYHRYRVTRGGDGDSFDWGRFGDPVSEVSDIVGDTAGLPQSGGSDDDIPF